MRAEKKHLFWITWEKQVRNRGLSSSLNASYYEFNYNLPRLLRYTLCLARTLKVLMRARGHIVFVQNPSIVLSVVAVILRPIMSYKLVVDAHNSAIFPNTKALKVLSAFVFKHANYILVSNKNLVESVSFESREKVLVLPDPLPQFENIEYLRSLEVDTKKIVFICSWAEDEPYFEVFDAAYKLPEFEFYITGKLKGVELQYKREIPKNVILTGYLSDDEYHNLLATSSVIIDLTTRENCLVCGAYEALALERPFLISDKKAIREYFTAGCVYVDNTSTGIIQGIDELTANYNQLKDEVRTFSPKIQKAWDHALEKVNEAVHKY